MPDWLRRHREVDEAEQTRRRFARRQWTRRWQLGRVLAAALALLLVVGVGIWLVAYSSVLGVKEVEVQGTELLSAEQVRAEVQVADGEPLARVDIDAVAARIEELPAVRSVDVSRKWPNSLLVQVTERAVVAVIQVGAKYRGMDETGTIFRNFARIPKGVPLIKASGELSAEVRAEGASVVGAMPASVARRVEYVELRTVDQINLVLRDGRNVVWGSAEESATKGKVLEVLLAEDGTTLDVSVPGNPTVK
ncbi:FtsQ-type POTRA domain-containing protein [Nocardioides dubius]|uniref:FtsQ-type POTRA domain-containing protein n=1 Tax=Nocardioides dubius TaxID=317019 RepID=A0ABP4E723_9ACTN